MRHAQKRITDLLHKADAVDKAEHERVTLALKAAQEQLAQAQADVEQLRPFQASASKLTEDVNTMRSSLSSIQVRMQLILIAQSGLYAITSCVTAVTD